MIVINDVGLLTLESIESVIKEMEKSFHQNEYKPLIKMYHEFLLDCFDADIKLQEMVNKNISEDFISFTIIPVLETDDLTSFSFELASQSGEKIKKRDELKYREFCRICFEYIKPFYFHIIEFYDKP